MSKNSKRNSAPVTTMVPNKETGELEVVSIETAPSEEISSEKPVKASRKRGLDENDPFMKQVIVRVNSLNPKRKGSKSFARYSLYREGMTVGQFLKAGGTRGDINWDTAHEHISLTAQIVETETAE